MPVPVDIRERWIETRLVDELDRPIKVKPWMRKHILEALDGYKAWRRGDRVCSKCAAIAGEIFPSRAACVRRPHAGCDGLEGHKITTVLIHLKRQQGKSTGGSAYALSDVFLSMNTNILFVGSSEDSTEEIFEAKLKAPIYKNPKLKRKVSIVGDRITNAKKGNKIKFIATGLKSTPGGTWRLIIIDEAALVSDRVAAKLIPAITAARGRECPEGHFTCGATEDAPTQCPLCMKQLEEFHGRVLVMSSSDEPTGFFFEMLEAEANDPTPSAHVFTSAETLNDHTSEEAISGIQTTWGRLPSMKGRIGREFSTEFTRHGDEFLPLEAIRDILRKDLVKLEASDRRCVGFLDCSRTGDITSLVLGADLEETDPPFEKITGIRVDVFDPHDKRQFPKGRVRYKPDPREPGKSIYEHLVALFGGWVDLDDKDSVRPLPNSFPGLLELWIDVTRWEEAKDLYEWARRQPWGGKAKPYHGNKLDKTLMWDELEARALAGRRAIELPYVKRLEDELKNAAVKQNDQGFLTVLDSSSGDRRGKTHRDIAMSVAGVCWAASKFYARGRVQQNAPLRAVTRVLRTRTRSLSSGIWKEKP